MNTFDTGGYDRFSAEYPFLRTCKVLFTQMVSMDDTLLLEYGQMVVSVI